MTHREWCEHSQYLILHVQLKWLTLFNAGSLSKDFYWTEPWLAMDRICYILNLYQTFSSRIFGSQPCNLAQSAWRIIQNVGPSQTGPCVKLPHTAGKARMKAIQGLTQPWPSWMWRRILFVEVFALHRMWRNLVRPKEVLNELVPLPEKPRYSSMAPRVKQAVGNLSSMWLCQYKVYCPRFSLLPNIRGYWYSDLLTQQSNQDSVQVLPNAPQWKWAE